MKTSTKKQPNLFDHFGTQTEGLKTPASNTHEENVIAFAEHFDNITEPGHGMFFDFKQTPELEKPVLDYLIKGFGWTLEKPFFIRKTVKQT